jgi:hypothetical protein
MSLTSSDCSGQGSLRQTVITIGSDAAVGEYFDAVTHWLVFGAHPAPDPVPTFNSQLVHGIGAFCQSVDLKQGGPVLPVVAKIDRETFTQAPLRLQ